MLFFIYLFLGTLGKMRRNMFNTNDIVKNHLDKLGLNDEHLKTIMSMLNEIKKDIQQFSFHMRMDSIDVSDFFPLKNDDDLKRFMDKNHEEWPLRRRGFYHLLFTTVTKNQKRFGTAMLHTLFSRQFISNHRWPLPGYVIQGKNNIIIYNIYLFFVPFTMAQSMNKSELPVLDQDFVAFLKATLGKMAGTDVIDRDHIALDFWSGWPRKFYNVRSYDLTKGYKKCLRLKKKN